MDNGTIVARITGPPPAPVAIVRLSGPDAFPIASALFPGFAPPPKHGRLVFGRFAHGDEGYAVAFEEGRSYTGEPTVEMHVHGSAASVSALLRRACSQGARMAEPGEFSLRAFLNGRIDLAQAEGVCDTVAAVTERQARLAEGLRDGRFSAEVIKARCLVLDALAAVEASTDFPDEVGELDRDQCVARLDEALLRLGALTQGAAAGRIVREGFRVVVCGRPNAGKSSLFNRLLGSDRAIVTAEPGTTRDEIEAWTALEGVPVQLYDVAGLREADAESERLGVDRARARAATADLVLYVYDMAAGWGPADEHELSGLERPLLVVANKCDLGRGRARPGEFALSALRGDGLDDLAQALREAAVHAAEAASPLNERHRVLLERSGQALEEARAGLSAGDPTDLAAVGLHAAARRLGEIVGHDAGPDVLDAVFSRFCVGK
jgi:tRNA modification GTPase